MYSAPPLSAFLTAKELTTSILRISRGHLYEMQRRGLLVTGVRLGERRVGYPAHEIEKIIDARTRGASDDDVRALVRKLMHARNAVRSTDEL